MVEAQKLQIIGISVRTTNKNNHAAADLGGLWKRLFTDEIAEKTPNKLSDDIYCIYTDYESDYTGMYTTILGFSVSNLESVPEGMLGRQFEAENFLHYEAIGPMPEAVVEKWNYIWENDKVLKRKYTYDLEIYGEKSQQTNQSIVDIYIAVKV